MSVVSCSVRLPKAKLAGLQAVIRTLNRSGATLYLNVEDLAGHVVGLQDSLEVDLKLPRNGVFGPRAINGVGSVVRISDWQPGKVWLIVRFHSLQVRDISQETQGVNSTNHRGLLARENELPGSDWAEFKLPHDDVQ